MTTVVGNLSDLNRSRQAEFDEKVDVRVVVKGSLVAIEGHVAVRNKPGFSWFKPADDVQPLPVYNRRIADLPGMPAIVGYTQGGNVLRVLDEDADELKEITSSTTVSTPFLPLHGSDHIWGAHDLVYLHPEAIVPLMVYPSQTGLVVNIARGEYGYGGQIKEYFGKFNLDLSASQPGAGLKRYVGIYLDAANLLQTVDGPTAALALAVTPEPVWPAGAYRLAVVLVNDTQTNIAFGDVFNRKVIWTDPTSGGGVATQIGQVSFSVDGVLFSAELPVTGPAGWLVNDDGILIVVG